MQVLLVDSVDYIWVALFHETEQNLTKPNDYCRQMCYKNVLYSNISIPLSMHYIYLLLHIINFINTLHCNGKL